MGAKGARSKSPRFLFTLQPNTILKPNPDPNAHPSPEPSPTPTPTPTPTPNQD